jgi:hypothetical protein
MKTKVFLLIVLFAFSAISFNSYSNEKVLGDEKMTDQLYVMKVPKYGTSEELVFTGDDIQSFNLTTREIVFVDSVSDKVMTKLKEINWEIFNIYLNDTLLFKRIFFLTPLSSGVVNDLVFFLDYNYFDPEVRLYLNDGYPAIHDSWILYGESAQKEREENAEKRKAGWDIFMQYLSDAGKMVENTGINGVKTELPIQIYGSGKTIYVDNPTGKDAVVTVYGVGGVKVAEQKMISQTTTVEMPVSGFYLVSVKTENEKPVTAKLILK